MPQPTGYQQRSAKGNGPFPDYQDCGLVYELTGGDPAIAVGATSTNLGAIIKDTSWVRRALLHLKLGGRAQPVIYRRLSNGEWDVGTFLTDITFAIADWYPLEVPIAGSDQLRIELKNTHASAPLATASVWLELYDS